MSKSEAITRLTSKYSHFDLQSAVQNRMPSPSAPTKHLVQVQSKLTIFEFVEGGQARTVGAATGLAEAATASEAEDLAIIRAIENLGV